MEITINHKYPQDVNVMWAPLAIEVSGLNLPGITIEGRTCTREGAKIKILHNGEPMENHEYNYLEVLGYENKMAGDAADDINDIMAMCDIKAKTSYTQLLPIMRQVRAKCESRYGHELPGCDYEVLVIFLPQ